MKNKQTPHCKIKIIPNIILAALLVASVAAGGYFIHQEHQYDGMAEVLCGNGDYNPNYPTSEEEQWDRYLECNSETNLIQLISSGDYRNDAVVSFATAVIALAIIILYNKK